MAMAVNKHKTLKYFFIVLARDKKYVAEKIAELEKLKVPYIIICGEKLNHPKVIYRPPKGKYDAINYSINFIPSDIDIVVFNDVDTKIISYEHMFEYFKDPQVAIVHALECVPKGPQASFFRIFNIIRAKIPLAGTGELLMIRKYVLKKILPIPPTKAEDTYLIFKSMELGFKVICSSKAKIITYRTNTFKEEEEYKKRTVTGILQTLNYTRPPIYIRLIYIFLPFLIPALMLILGTAGFYISKGIIEAYINYYVFKDKEGYW